MSKGRTYLNRTLLSYFSEFFPDGSVIREAGKHRRHHYSVYFPECDFQSVDQTAEDGAEIQDSMEELKTITENSVDGWLFIGMHDVLKNPERAMKEILRTLKPGGRVLAGLSGPGYQDMDFAIKDIQKFMEGLTLDEIRCFYGPENDQYYTDGPMTVAFVIGRKPK